MRRFIARLTSRGRIGRALGLTILMLVPAVFAASANAEPMNSMAWSECAPGVLNLGFSDRLDKTTYDGTNVGGLSGLAYDKQRDVY